jgi:hypothetical protein
MSISKNALLVNKFFHFYVNLNYHLRRKLTWTSYWQRKVNDLDPTYTEGLLMDSCLLTSTLDVTESHPQSRSSRSRRTSTGSVGTPLFSGRAVILSTIATRRHSYLASLNNDTSLSSEITQAL